MCRSIYIMVMGICLLCMTGCNKYLEREPLDGPPDQDFFTNAEELMLAVNGCYEALNYQPTGSNLMPLALTADNCTDISWDRNNSALQQIGNGSHDSYNGTAVSVWTAAYKDIARCNFLLDNIDKVKDRVTPALYARAKAEARFIRAYNYHYLVELFGDVPLVTKSLTLAEAQLPRTGKEKVVDFILTELEEAAPDLPVTYDAIDYGRATRGAALAIRARTALYNKRWDIAADAAKAVMNLNVYSLHPDFGELFAYAGKNSKEAIFVLTYLKGVMTFNPSNFYSRLGGGASNKVPGQALIDSYLCTDGLPIDQSPLYDPQHPFANRDPRLGYTVALPGSVFLNYTFETHQDSTMTFNYNTPTPTRVANLDATHAFATYTGYCWRKYTDIADKADNTHSEISTILIRFAEVLLIYAEAKIEADEIDQSVYDAIDAVRQRPGVNMPPVPAGSTQAALRSVVRRERKYELANEGLRLFDIRRWGIAEQVMKGTFYGRVPDGYLATAPAIDENGTPDYANVPDKAALRVVETRMFNPKRDYLWPIPNIEILTDKKMTQNPGY